jgi:hypothetical protein
MRKIVKLFSALCILTAVASVHAQQQGGPPNDPGAFGGGPGGGPGGPGGPDDGPPDPQRMQQMIDQRIKQAMNPTDDAWTKLQPLIDKVTELEHQTDTGPRMFGPPHRDDDDMNNDDNHPQNPVESALSKLKKVLSDKGSSDATIAAATKVVEDAEKKAQDDLATARADLKAAADLRQQAVLVAMGVLN